MRILFYAANGIGLGHLRRTSLVAQEIRKKERNVKIGLATSSSQPKAFGSFYDNLFKLIPFSDKLEKSQSGFSSAKFENGKKFLKAVKKFKPGLIVADFHIFSRSFPFYPVKYALDNHPTKSAYIWRFKNFRNSFVDLRTESYKFSYFDKIIIAHAKKELKDLSPVSFLKKIENDSRFEISGPILKEIDLKEEEICKKKYKVSDKDFLITLTLGGGGGLKENNFESPDKILNNFLKIFPVLKKEIPNLKSVITLGPYLSSFKKKNLPGVKFIKFEKNILGLMKNSKMVISPTGYNTSNDLIESKTPSILIPLKREGDEQLERAKYLKNQGICRIIEEVSPDKLLQAILESKECLSQMKKGFKNFSEWRGGNEKAARIILDLL